MKTIKEETILLIEKVLAKLTVINLPHDELKGLTKIL
jgi:hypothetical protein